MYLTLTFLAYLFLIGGQKIANFKPANAWWIKVDFTLFFVSIFEFHGI